MKKYILSILTIALFAVGFAASDEDESSSSGSQMEQKQETETEAERQAREQREKESQKEKKKKEIAEAGYKKGYEDGFAETLKLPDAAKIVYRVRYGAPTNSEEMELFRIFEENYNKGFDEGHKAR